MTTRRATPALDALLAQVRQVGGRYVVVWELPQRAVDEAGWLAAGGRDFFSVTASMQGAVARAAVDAVRRGGLATLEAVVPQAVRDHVARRFETGGFDVSLVPLTTPYARWKAKHGLDPRVGVATGLLLRAVKAATVRLRKAG